MATSSGWPAAAADSSAAMVADIPRLTAVSPARSCRVLPARLSLLDEGARSLLLVGVAPHPHEVLGPEPAGVGQAQLEGAPERLLRGAERRCRDSCLSIGDTLGLVAHLTSRGD